MKILNSEAGLTKGIFPGRFCYKLEMSNHGIEMSVDQIVKQAIHFPRIVITGDEPFLQREELAKFIRKIKSQNPLVTFDIYTKGKERPVKIGNIENINYIVTIDMLNTEALTEENIDRQTMTWFITMGAHFLFEIVEEGDVDRVMFMAREYNINKSRIYLCSYKVNMIASKAKIIGCNYALVMDGGFANEYRTEDKKDES